MVGHNIPPNWETTNAKLPNIAKSGFQFSVIYTGCSYLFGAHWIYKCFHVFFVVKNPVLIWMLQCRSELDANNRYDTFEAIVCLIESCICTSIIQLFLMSHVKNNEAIQNLTLGPFILLWSVLYWIGHFSWQDGSETFETIPYTTNFLQNL